MIPIFTLQLPTIMLYQQEPPGFPDPSGGGRYFAADKFDVSFDSTTTLSRYVPVGLLQCNDIFMRIRKWRLTGTARYNLDEQPEPFIEFPDEYQVITFGWEDASNVLDEIHLLESLDVRPGFYTGSSDSWRGFSSVAVDTVTPDPDGSPVGCAIAGTTGSLGPGPYSDPSNGDGDLRFLEWAYANGTNTWTLLSGGFISFDFKIRGALWKSSALIQTYPYGVPYEAFAIGTTASDFVIAGRIGSIDSGRESPILGTRDGYQYNWILEPTEFWSWDGTYDTATGLPL